MMAHSHDPNVPEHGHGAGPHDSRSHDEHVFGAHAHDDHGGIGKYLAVFAALCVLTGMSFFTYSNLWPFGKQVAWAFMMAVSCTKAMLVIMFFMHLLWEANWKWVLTVPASCMSLFLVLALVPDIGMRQDNGFATYSRERLYYAAEPPSDSDKAPGETDETATPHSGTTH